MFIFIGITFHQTSTPPHKMRPVKPNRTLVLIYSCGANEGDDGMPRDHLGEYVEDIFKMIGFEHFHVIRIQGLSGKSSTAINTLIGRKTDTLANILNRKFK